jgi:hypothetical protein
MLAAEMVRYTHRRPEARCQRVFEVTISNCRRRGCHRQVARRQDFVAARQRVALDHRQRDERAIGQRVADVPQTLYVGKQTFFQVVKQRRDILQIGAGAEVTARTSQHQQHRVGCFHQGDSVFKAADHSVIQGVDDLRPVERGFDDSWSVTDDHITDASCGFYRITHAGRSRQSTCLPESYRHALIGE